MPSIALDWETATGFEPPPPYTPDCYKVFVWYRGQRKPSYDFTECGTHFQISDVAGGEYTFHVHGTYDGEISQAFATETIVVSGAQVAPEGGNPPPEGNPDIAAPGTLILQEL